MLYTCQVSAYIFEVQLSLQKFKWKVFVAVVSQVFKCVTCFPSAPEESPDGVHCSLCFFFSHLNSQSYTVSHIAYVYDIWEYYFAYDLLYDIYSMYSFHVHIERTIGLTCRRYFHTMPLPSHQTQPTVSFEIMCLPKTL